MAQDFDDLVKNLTAKMLAKKFYAVFWKAHDKPELIREKLPDHLKFLIALEKEGRVFGSGPLTGAGSRPGDGLTILRAEDADEARAIASQDPFVVAGARTFEIREWTLMEGSLNLRIDFSDQTYRFD
ncbi:MAG: YciI family protein [Beijerinckiaceae bacterium]